MSLEAGQKLGPYEVISPIGKGGMGEVYKAKDTRLDRIVAIKVLHSHLAESLERRERFEREARAVSSLNHPHICTLYDVGREEGVDFLVMEYLEGETLADRLKKGAIPLEQALRHAVEIADALDNAHKQGVVHRDLKPGNIILTKSGAKLLDFGLAKLHGTAQQGMDLSALVTADKPLTDEGTILGTLQYMAPEQLEGKTADARTDIFAFGAVVYEMVTGKRAFEGKTQASLIGAIMEQDPVPMVRVQPVSPPALERTVKRCLAKSPDERWYAAHDLKYELDWIAESGEGVEAAPTRTAPKSRERVFLVLSAFLLVLVVILASAYFARGPEDVGATARLAIPLPPETIENILEISPDGRRLAFIAPSAEGVPLIWVRDLETGNVQALAGTESAWSVFWSPDSRSLGFTTSSLLRMVGLSGEPPETLRDAPFWGGGSWNDDDVMLLAHDGVTYRVPAAGGQPVPVASGTGSLYLLPDGVHFLYSSSDLFERGGIYVGSLESDETRFVVESDSKAVWANGYLLFVQSGDLMAQRFDTTRLRLEGEPRAIGRQLMPPDIRWGGHAFSASRNGVLAFRSGRSAVGQLVWLDRQGRELDRVPQPPSGEYVNPALSRDGKRIAVNRKDPATGNVDIWLIEAETGLASRFTSNPWPELDAVWSPDGERIAFSAFRDGAYGLWVKETAGGEEELVWHPAAIARSFNLKPTDWSADGDYVVCDLTGDVWVVPVSGDREPWAILDSEFLEYRARLSPDGKWVAYVSNETGTGQLYVASFPDGGNKQRLSESGAHSPRWRDDGRELFYRGGYDRVAPLMRVEIASGPSEFRASTPTQLFEPPIIAMFDRRTHYAVAPDAERFLLRRPSLDPPPVTVIVNWTAELEHP